MSALSTIMCGNLLSPGIGSITKTVWLAEVPELPWYELSYSSEQPLRKQIAT